MDNLEEVSRPDGIIRHTLKTTNGLECEVSNYGCRILRLLVPDRDGEFEDIV
ncbi:MAG: hypothetical protein ACI9A8_000821, partial [Cryomorphaceae bacterium]